MSGAVAQLGYLRLGVRDPRAWADLLGGCVGAAVAGMRVRLDEHATRIQLVEDPADDVLACGWEAPDEVALARIGQALAAAGHAVTEGTAQARAERGVEHLLHATDPAGLPVDLYAGPAVAPAAATPLVPGGFVAGDEGLGHAVIASRDLDASLAFYRQGLGLRTSDHIRAQLGDVGVHVAFLHANPRHHSLAFSADIPLSRRLHHFMLEYASLDDLGRAWYRCMDAGVPIVRSLGSHPNDRMLSFYVRTPSGFELELGWGGVRVDDAGWRVRTYAELSTWGHRVAAAGG